MAQNVTRQIDIKSYYKKKLTKATLFNKFECKCSRILLVGNKYSTPDLICVSSCDTDETGVCELVVIENLNKIKYENKSNLTLISIYTWHRNGKLKITTVK